jgi:hypothetical protein
MADVCQTQMNCRHLRKYAGELHDQLHVAGQQPMLSCVPDFELQQLQQLRLAMHRQRLPQLPEECEAETGAA